MVPFRSDGWQVRIVWARWRGTAPIVAELVPSGWLGGPPKMSDQTWARHEAGRPGRHRVGNAAAGSRIAACRVGDLRVIGFDVIRDPLPEDPGHALILPGAIDLSARTPRKRLANLFRYIDMPDRSDEGPAEQT